MFEKVISKYTKYIGLGTTEKLHSEMLLENSAQELLKIDIDDLDIELAVQKKYLTKKIADDLLDHARDMGYSKEFEFDPKIIEYTYLAFNLIYDYFDFKPNSYLLPFVKSVIYYEEQSGNKKRIDELQKLLSEIEAMR